MIIFSTSTINTNIKGTQENSEVVDIAIIEVIYLFC